ncbi:class I SAM-dependent methyltransferase [Egbenema bharatensis]|uniref:class I SAM-dependent methyltransferase n=1 Tax=Egbenema bharatensis TaxID=3463334 RepID=UPI003A8A0E5B
MAETLTKLAYQTFQQGKSYFGLAHKTLSTQLMNFLAPDAKQGTEPLSPALLGLIQQRLNDLIDRDWLDAEQGVYPTHLLFDNPWEDFFRFYPFVWLDMPTIWGRAAEKRYQDFSTDIRTEGYPSYYVQNFHHQTDGYLSETSANLYDLQVEILFNGTADAMRRRTLLPLKRGLEVFNLPDHQTRVLDVACGTGRTLRQIQGMLPDTSLYGVDLSPAYLRKANQLLADVPGALPQLIQANAESIPFLNDYFHGIVSVFLFHELPPEVRQTVIEESFRVLQPGGVFVICDSIQLSDSPELAPAMRNFPTMFHEPYYRHYTTDDLADRLEKAGFMSVQTEVHFMSKYWIARKAA